MPEIDLLAFLAGARVDPAVFRLRPDYRALLLAVGGLDTSTPGDETSNALLIEAESTAHTALKARPVEEVEHAIGDWKTYRNQA
jgi:hypothetical protein